MHVAAVGVGGAGCRVLDTLARDDAARDRSYLAGTAALDTDAGALDRLGSVDVDDRHAFGSLAAGGGGTDGDPEAGAAAAEEDRAELRRAIGDAATAEADAVLLIAGMAGGTGAGATPVLAAAARETLDRPVYALSVLPAAAETTADRSVAATVRRGVERTADAVDAQLLFDVELWLKTAEDLADARDRLNRQLVERVGALFAAGESTAGGVPAERVVDASEVLNTLGSDGYAVLGYAAQAVREPPSLFDRLLSREPDVDDVAAVKAVETTTRRAVNGKLTCACERDAAGRALLVVGGPPAWLNRQAVADARSWLGEEVGSVEVRSGDAPDESATDLTAVALLAGLETTERLGEFGVSR